jgi:hypothetical protein
MSVRFFKVTIPMVKTGSEKTPRSFRHAGSLAWKSRMQGHTIQSWRRVNTIVAALP